MMLRSKLPLTTTFQAVFLASTLSCAAFEGSWGEDADVGTIAFSLKMPGDMANADLDYTISGGGSFQKSGTIPLSTDTHTFSATIEGIPVGKGYQLTLDSTAQNAAMSCNGAATFEIAWANYTANVPVKLQCHIDKPTAGSGGASGSGGTGGAGGSGGDGGDGSIDVGGGINLCPVIDGLYIWRESSGDIEFSSSACDDDSGPEPLTHKWTVSKGTLAESTGPIVMFTCPDSCGVVEVTLEVSDSECTDKWTEAFDCDDKTVGPAKRAH